MATKHMKRCSTSLAIREIKIKSIGRYHCLPIRTANVKKNAGFLIRYYWEFKDIQPLWQIVWQFCHLKKNTPKYVLTIQTSDRSSGHLFQRNTNLCPLANLYENVHSCFICNSPKLETTRPPIKVGP